MEKILIVEDEALIGLDIKARLNHFGYENVVIVGKAEDALSKVEEDLPSLILMDINLKSDLDGIDLAGILNSTYRIPIVFLTSYSDFDTMDRAKEAAPYGYLVKPIEPQALYSMVTMALRRSALESTLIEQNRLFEAVLENSTEGIVVVDEQFRIMYFNHVFMNIFEIESGNIFGENFKKELSCYVKDLDEKIDDDFISQGGTARLDICPSGKARKTVIMNVSSFTLEDEKDRHLILFSDLSELEQVKKELDLSVKNFDEIFEKSREALMLLKVPEGVLAEMNPACEKLLGFRKHETKENMPALLEMLGSESCGFMNEVQGESVCTLKVTERGNVIFLIISQKLVISGTEYLYLSFKDITEARKLEERERQLQNRMIHTNKMTALGTLVAGVAHEINNPNNFIMFNSRILLDLWGGIKEILDRVEDQEGEFEIEGLPYSTLREDIGKLLEGISSGSERIKKIVQELKDFSKGDVDRMNDMINLEDVLSSSVKIIKQHIMKHTSNFSVEINSPVPRFKGNKQKVEQIIINLVLNALEALADKNGSVSVSCSAGEDGSAVLSVRDTGNGIPEAIVKRITEPFFTTKQKEGGTGLGLSIVYSFVKEHGGEIDFISETGKGTRVLVSFPSELGNA
jgi:PAS domain S-box-containing protein